MKIDRIAETELNHVDEQQISDLLAICFDTGFQGRSYYYQRHNLRLVVRDRGVIVGHLAILIRAVRLGDQQIDITGIAEVAVHPSQRGKNIASCLLQKAMDVSKSSPAQFCVLFGDRPLYAGHGFQRQPNQMTYLSYDDQGATQLETGLDDGLMVLPLRDQLWDGAAHLDLLGRKF